MIHTKRFEDIMLDLRTLYFTVACICLCLGALLLGKAFVRRRDAWVLWCSVSNLLLGSGFAANASLEWAPKFVTITCANGLTIAGFLTSVISARALAERQTPFFVWPCLVLSALFGALLLGDAESGYGVRVGIMSLVFAACEFFVAYVGVHIARKEHLKTAWALAAVFATTGFVFLARTYLAFFGALNANPSDHIFLAIIAVTVVCLRPMTMLLVGSERRQQNWERLALHDPLTGALNRAGLLEMTERHTQNAARANSLSACVLLIDVDRFKAVNDSEGHDAGDALLCLVTEIIRSEIRKTDLISRQGGDEFVVLLREADLEAAFLVAERIRTRFQEAAQLRHDHIEPTLSIGISTAPNARANLVTLLNQADQALYTSKRAGRNTVSKFSIAA
ncbi:GGDEF domain-containing protein (plasmid) [Rhizobium jaguaris]|uniref:diguanylate cyclase n=2 Tax=Rhizobium jaguaris TaxID=1312183 RepID=A0A387FZ71_9HYPH|nr:GGDEF domain-containing protein [Rhizobium jaguaris]